MDALILLILVVKPEFLAAGQMSDGTIH